MNRSFSPVSDVERMLAEINKEKQKQAEKKIIESSVAKTSLANSSAKVTKFETSTTQTLAVTRSSVQNVLKGLDSSLKGDWGKKAREVFTQNDTKLGSL